MVPTNLLVLISCDPNELRLFEDECSEGGVGELEDVAGSYQVEPRLILVHRVQDCLENMERNAKQLTINTCYTYL